MDFFAGHSDDALNRNLVCDRNRVSFPQTNGIQNGIRKERSTRSSAY